MSPPFTPPKLDEDAFNCPNCGTYAHQHWGNVYADGNYQWRLDDWKGALCAKCGASSLWCSGVMVYPSGGTAPLPNPDLPQDIQDDYEEARAILACSPRGAAALLRLAIQKLCKSLGLPGSNINNDIAELVKGGLLPAVQQALDAVRVIGNDAVHPGQIDLRDKPETASALFQLVNLVADQMITAPKQAAAVYASLPEKLRHAVAKRDGRAP
jgi:hypothetical protein